MKISLLSILCAGFIITSCMAPSEKQYFTDSPDIDLGKKIIDAYLAQDWDAYSELYSDTARIIRNVNWTTNEGFTVDEYIEDLKVALETASSYTFDPQIWESIINDDGQHWVHFWGIWVGHNTATDKDYEIPVHVSMQVVDNKVVWQGDLFNNTQVTLDMMALAEEAEDDDEEHDDDDDDDDDDDA